MIGQTITLKARRVYSPQYNIIKRFGALWDVIGVYDSEYVKIRSVGVRKETGRHFECYFNINGDTRYRRIDDES